MQTGKEQSNAELYKSTQERPHNPIQILEADNKVNKQRERLVANIYINIYKCIKTTEQSTYEYLR